MWDRKTGKAIHNAIVWQDRRTAERCAELAASGHGPRVRALTGLTLDPVLLGHQGRLDHPRRRRRRRATPARRARVRHHRLVLDVAVGQVVPFTRPSTCQRVAHDVVRPRVAGVERRAARSCSAFRARAAPEDRPVVGQGRGHRGAGRARRRPDRRRRGRSTSGAVWTSVLHPRHGEVHIRHRRLHRGEHR